MTKLRNTTNVPDPLVREVIAFVRPHGVRNVDVYVENRSWGVGSGWASNRGYVTVRLQDGAMERPRRWTPQHERGYVFDGWLHDETELLVMLLAHELRHQWQFGVGQSFGETMRRNSNRERGAYIGVNVTRVVHDPNLTDNDTVVRGRTVFHRARVEMVRRVRRRPVLRRRGQKGGREEDADRYAMKMVRAWRREHPVEPWWGAAEVMA